MKKRMFGNTGKMEQKIWILKNMEIKIIKQ